MERELEDKIRTPREAIKLIRDGSSIALDGFVITRCPVALTHEIIRQDKRDLTLSGMACFTLDLLVGAGLVKKLEYCGCSLEPIFGEVSRINQAIINKEVKIEEYSGTSLFLRYLAGALGIPYIPTKTLLGSDVLKGLLENDFAKVDECPFTKEKLVLLRALSPDITIVHAQQVDTEGNASISGPLLATKETVRASRNVIVCAEEVVDPEVTRRHPERTVIPSFMVDVFVHTPYGAHPTSVYGYYDYDAEHIGLYAKASRERETFGEYLEEYVLGLDDHQEYLEKIGVGRLLKLKANPLWGY